MKQVYETRDEAGDAQQAMREAIDVYADWNVYAGNRQFTDEVQGIRFLNGSTEIKGLERGAKEREVEARERLLNWFCNGEPKEVVVRLEDDEDGRRSPVYGWRLPYRLERAGVPEKAEKKAAAASAA